MNYQLLILAITYTQVVPAVAGLARVKKISSEFLPFLLIIWIGVINEIISTILIRNSFPNAINSNIYSLIEAFLIVWQFWRWKLFRERVFVNVIAASVVIMFIVDNLFISTIHRYNSYFGIYYSFLVVLMSIQLINKLIGCERLLRNPAFIICVAFVFYYTYKILVETFWLYGLNTSDIFRAKVYRILNYIHVFSNLIFTLAILWMPRKREYIPRF